MQSNQIVIATILDQVHFRISSSSSYYGLIIICLLLPWRGLTIKIGLNYAINIALSYQIQFTRLLLIGDSLIVGLFYYPNIWRIYFKPLSGMNLWCRRRWNTKHSMAYKLLFAIIPFFLSTDILCGTNNIQRDSSEDTIDGILQIPLTLRRKYNHLNIVVCGLPLKKIGQLIEFT